MITIRLHIEGIAGSFVIQAEESTAHDATLTAHQALALIQVLLSQWKELVNAEVQRLSQQEQAQAQA